MLRTSFRTHLHAKRHIHTTKKQNEQTSARYYKRGAQQNHLCDVFVTAPAVPRQTRRRRATICSNAHAQRAHARRFFFFARIVGFNFQRARASAAIRTLRGAQLFITSHQTPTHTHRPNGQTRRHQRAPAPVPALQLI